MYQAARDLLANPMVIRVLTAIGGLIVVLVITRLSSSYIGRWIVDADMRYRARKVVTSSIWLAYAIYLLLLFSQSLGQAAVALGVASAGIAFALQEVILSLAGWIAISFGTFFRIGDRIQLGNTVGDVIDIGMLRTTVMECREWISGDNYTGRIVRIPNSMIFRQPVHNYSGDFPFLWDELKLPVRYESDYDRMREILLEVADEITGQYTQYAELHWKRMLRRYRVEPARVDPTVVLVANDNWVEFTLRYIVDYKYRRQVRDELFRAILRRLDLERDTIRLASATWEIVAAPELDVRLKGGTDPQHE
ncbi:MAG: mechanosensitive ion channel [candidate division WS1 bacterium]|nr:mechanosensitive ion channel [candidate division WS1 bacterium]